ncbi:unnamed protein product [Heterobilharzia americana]|nr:unnamed protein product [Heterobilharzia americana]
MGPYLIQIGSELRQKLTVFSTQHDPDLLITLTVKGKDTNQENSNSLIVGEEHTWIRVIHETGLRSDKNDYNLDILVYPILKTITLQVKSDINPQDSLIGVVRIVSGYQKISDQITMSSCHSSALFNNSKLSTSSSTLLSSSTNTTSTGPKRDKKCTHCGIPFSNLDTLNAHMTQYCSKRPGLISSTSTTVIQPSASVTTTTTISDNSSINKNIANKLSHSHTSFQRQNSSQSFRTSPIGFNSVGNVTSPTPVPRYGTLEEGSVTESNSLNIRDAPIFDPAQISNLINPALLNLFGVNDGTNIYQMFQNPLASFMLPMISRLIPQTNLDTTGNVSNFTTPVTNLCLNNPLSPTSLTSLKHPSPTSDKPKSCNQSSECTTSNNCYDTHLSSTTTPTLQNNMISSLTDYQKPRILFCPNCQQLYTSQYLSTYTSKSNNECQSSSRISSEISSVNQNIESVDNISWNLSQLSEAAHRFGLILAVPLVTANGLQYIPVDLSTKLINDYSSKKRQQYSNSDKNSLETANKKRQYTTPNLLSEVTNDSLNPVNITSPISSSSFSTNHPNTKHVDTLIPRLNTPNILDLSINPSNTQMLNPFALYNAINEFRGIQQQQQSQQNYHPSQLFPQKRNDASDNSQDFSHSACYTRPSTDSISPPKMLSSSNGIHNNHVSISDNQKSNDNNNTTDWQLLQAFSQILSYTNELLSNSQTTPFSFNINQLLFMLYASITANSINVAGQPSLNFNPTNTGPVPVTDPSTVSSTPITNLVGTPCSISGLSCDADKNMDNCENSVTPSDIATTSSIHSNIYKRYSPLSSVSLPSICINPLIPSNDQIISTCSSSNLQNTFPILTTPMTNTSAGVITKAATNLSQDLNYSSPSVTKMDMNVIGGILNNDHNNNNAGNISFNQSAVVNILPALKLLGSIFPHFSTMENQQELHAQQTPSEINTNSKQVKLPPTRSVNNEQLTNPPTSPQPAVFRPYLCRFCQTRFLAFHTFQAHQQFYCQRRKELMKQLQTTTASSVTSQTSLSPGGSTTLNCPINSGPSANKRRCTTADSVSSNQHQTTGSALTNQRISANSSTSSSGDEAEGLKNSRLSPLSLKSSPNRSLQTYQDMNTDCETNQPTSTQWEPCGTSELRCSACGYVGQTPRGMKMHKKLHECNGTASKNTKSTSEMKTRTELKSENENLINTSNTNPILGKDFTSTSSTDVKNPHASSNDSNSVFSDDHVKKEQL